MMKKSLKIRNKENVAKLYGGNEKKRLRRERKNPAKNQWKLNEQKRTFYLYAA